MSAVTVPANTAPPQGLWQIALRRLARNPAGVAAAGVVAAFLVLILATAFAGLAAQWDDQVAASFAPPGWLPADPADVAAPAQPSLAVPAATEATAPIEMYGVVDPLAAQLALAQQHGAQTAEAPRNAWLLLGADKWGRSVAQKTLKGAQTSVLVGLAAALVATLIGTLLGALAGYCGGWVDAVIDWLYGVFTAVPYLLLVFAIAAVLQQKGVVTIVLILGLTGWTGVYRLIRAEYLKHKVREYVQAARAIGASHARRMFVHILPNVSHVVLVQLSQQVVSFIKAEVILSFLGFGVPVDVVSWGSMLNETPNELILGKWWQLAAAGLAMALLVTAFAMLTDALRDALDPRLK